MKEIKAKIRELLPKMHFLDKEMLVALENMLEDFSLPELEKIYNQLKEVNEKTIDHFDKILQKNPRFFEQAQSFFMKKKEAGLRDQDKVEISIMLDKLTTI